MSTAEKILENLVIVGKAFVALVEEREKIIDAVRDYHFALDNREHGAIVADHALNVIQNALGMPWVQGAEKKRRNQQ